MDAHEPAPDALEKLISCERLHTLAPDHFRVHGSKMPAALIIVALSHRATKTYAGALILAELGMASRR